MQMNDIEHLKLKVTINIIVSLQLFTSVSDLLALRFILCIDVINVVHLSTVL